MPTAAKPDLLGRSRPRLACLPDTARASLFALLRWGLACPESYTSRVRSYRTVHPTSPVYRFAPTRSKRRLFSVALSSGYPPELTRHRFSGSPDFPRSCCQDRGHPAPPRCTPSALKFGWVKCFAKDGCLRAEILTIWKTGVMLQIAQRKQIISAKCPLPPRCKSAGVCFATKGLFQCVAVVARRTVLL